MKFAGIIAEYDPFHNGHAWQLAQARALGAQRVAVAMSCGLTQRGRCRCCRRRCGCRRRWPAGQTLCLPCPRPAPAPVPRPLPGRGCAFWPLPGATRWSLGQRPRTPPCCKKAARVLCSEDYRAALRQQLAAGARSFAAARQAAVQALCPGSDVAALLDKPNNNLAVEYCKAIIEQNVEMQPIALPAAGRRPRAGADRKRPRSLCQRQRPAGALGGGRRGGTGALCAGKGAETV